MRTSQCNSDVSPKLYVLPEAFHCSLVVPISKSVAMTSPSSCSR